MRTENCGTTVSIIITVLLAFLLVCNLYCIAAKMITGEHPVIFGWSAAVVVSGSMSPAVEVDDMVIIHRKNDFSCDDIITYRDGGTLVTHRIKRITEDGLYITKGDANDAYDSDPVSRDSVVGVVVLVIPKIGRFISALRTPAGMCCVVLIGLLIIGMPSIAGKIKKHLPRDN